MSAGHGYHEQVALGPGPLQLSLDAEADVVRKLDDTLVLRVDQTDHRVDLTDVEWIVEYRKGEALGEPIALAGRMHLDTSAGEVVVPYDTPHLAVEHISNTHHVGGRGVLDTIAQPPLQIRRPLT